MSITEVSPAMPVHQENLQWSLEFAASFQTFHPFLTHQFVHLPVGTVGVVLLTPTHRALLAVLTMGQCPGEDACVTEEVLVGALMRVLHYQITAR